MWFLYDVKEYLSRIKIQRVNIQYLCSDRYHHIRFPILIIHTLKYEQGFYESPCACVRAIRSTAIDAIFRIVKKRFYYRFFNSNDR